MIIVNQTSKTRRPGVVLGATDGGVLADQEVPHHHGPDRSTTGPWPGSDASRAAGPRRAGRYTITEAFGNGLGAHDLDAVPRGAKGDYWVGDNQSRYYNYLRNKPTAGSAGGSSSGVNESENLRAFGSAVPLCGGDQLQPGAGRTVAYRGFGIFLHVKGSGATAGCVGITAARCGRCWPTCSRVTRSRSRADSTDRAF